MPLITPLVDYTSKDYTALLNRCKNLITSVFPEWTDFNVANFGNIMIQLYAHLGDILTFYQDAQGRQSRIMTATQRRAILGLVKLIGYTPLTATAARAQVTLSIPSTMPGDVVFPAGTIVKTEEVTSPIQYQLLADAVIPAGQTAVGSVDVENSVTQTDNFVFTPLPNQQITLNSTPYIDSTAIVTAGNGTYERVDNFLDSTASDLHYVLEVDQKDRASIKFGNGVSGAVPLGTGSVTYRTGGGSAGRVEANKLKLFEQSSWQDSRANPVIPSVINPAASQGGNDRQSIAQIQERGPASLRALTRSVAREDFEINALRLPAVGRALMMTSNEDPAVQENCGDLYIIPAAGGLPDATLKASVLAQVTTVYPCTLTFRVTVRDPVYRIISPNMIVYFAAGYVPAAVAAAIRANLAAFFTVQNADGTENENIDFGGNILAADGSVISELALSDVLNVVRDTPGVRKVPVTEFLLNNANEDVKLARAEFPQLGLVAITDADTGATL